MTSEQLLPDLLPGREGQLGLASGVPERLAGPEWLSSLRDFSLQCQCVFLYAA